MSDEPLVGQAIKGYYSMKTKGINLHNISVLNEYNSMILNKVPSELIDIHIKATEKIIFLIMFWYSDKSYEKNNYEFLLIHFLVVENYHNISYLLAVNGVTRLAWEYLIKSTFFRNLRCRKRYGSCM